MKRDSKFALVVLAATGLGFGGGFWVGAYVGLDQYFLMDSSLKASLLTHQLQMLRGGKVDYVIDWKETDLDYQIVRFSFFTEEGHPWLWWPLSREYDHDQHMRTVAVYRKEHPPILPTIKFSDDDPFKAEIDVNSAEVSKRIKDVLDKYDQ